MDDSTRIVLVRLIDTIKELGKHMKCPIMAGAVVTNLDGILEMLKQILKIIGGG